MKEDSVIETLLEEIQFIRKTFHRLTYKPILNLLTDMEEHDIEPKGIRLVEDYRKYTHKIYAEFDAMLEDLGKRIE